MINSSGKYPVWARPGRSPAAPISRRRKMHRKLLPGVESGSSWKAKSDGWLLQGGKSPGRQVASKDHSLQRKRLSSGPSWDPLTRHGPTAESYKWHFNQANPRNGGICSVLRHANQQFDVPARPLSQAKTT